MKLKVTIRLKGGVGSGNFGHSGRPGLVGGSGSGLAKSEYQQRLPQIFVEALQANISKKYEAFVTIYTSKEYNEMGAKCYVAPSGNSGYAIKPDGDIISVFSKKNSGEGPFIIESAKDDGGTKLDCFGGFLPVFYNKFGFSEYDRWAWDDQYAPKDWNYSAFGRPDVVFMELAKTKKEKVTKMKKDKKKGQTEAQRKRFDKLQKAYANDTFGEVAIPSKVSKAKKSGDD